jgi:hypothetical protein
MAASGEGAIIAPTPGYAGADPKRKDGHEMVRIVARRTFAAAAWAYVAAIGIQVFFAGMYVFGGPQNLELHRTFAHVFLLLTLALLVSAYAGRVSGADKRRFWTVFGLLVVQGMLVHIHQWFVAPAVAALHPVNALLLGYAALVMARKASVYWTERAGLQARAEPAGAAA